MYDFAINSSYIYRQVHDATEDPQEVIHMMTWMKDDALHAIEKKLLNFHPNTYTYSKRLAECLIRNEHNTMPVAIARPSIGNKKIFKPSIFSNNISSIETSL